MDALTSRPYTSRIDLQPVIQLVRICHAVEDSDPWPPIAEVRHYLRVKDNTPSADTHAGSQHDRREGWIDWLGTHPAFRQRGLGRALLRAGLQQLKHLGADIALLGTASWNVQAQHLFASEGFRLLHHVRWFAWEDDEGGKTH